MERGQVKWIVYQNKRANGYRFTVWANGKQNSGLANFVLDSRSPFAQIKSIFPKKVYESLQPVSKVNLMKWKTNFCLEHLVHKTLPFQKFCCSQKFFFNWNDLKSHVPFAFQLDFLETFCIWLTKSVVSTLWYIHVMRLEGLVTRETNTHGAVSVGNSPSLMYLKKHDSEALGS